jgi:hypothetical protein
MQAALMLWNFNKLTNRYSVISSGKKRIIFGRFDAIRKRKLPATLLSPAITSAAGATRKKRALLNALLLSVPTAGARMQGTAGSAKVPYPG